MKREDKIKQEILGISKDGKILGKDLDKILDDNDGRLFLKAIHSLLDDGFLKEAFKPIPGTSYSMNYINTQSICN